MAAGWYRQTGDGLLLDIAVQTRASQDEITGLHAGRLRIRITASPIEGKANRYLLTYLSKEFGVAKTKVEIISGLHNKFKSVLIHSPKQTPEWLCELLRASNNI